MSEPKKITVELEAQEVVALVKYHCSQSTRMNKRLGVALLKLKASSPLWSGRTAREMVEEATKIQKGHMARARQLADLLPSKKEGA